MSTDWAAEQKGVYEDIKEEGFEITIRVPGVPGAFDEDLMTYADGTDPVDVTTYGLKKKYSINQIDGTIVQQKDTRLIFPSYGLAAFTTNKQILIDSVVQNVVSVVKLDPGNVALIYEVQIRE